MVHRSGDAPFDRDLRYPYLPLGSLDLQRRRARLPRCGDGANVRVMETPPGWFGESGYSAFPDCR